MIASDRRLAACKIAKVKPTTVVYDGDPVAYLLARNERRRHMTKGQVAMASWLTAATHNDYESDGSMASEVGVSTALVQWARTVVLDLAECGDVDRVERLRQLAELILCGRAVRAHLRMHPARVNRRSVDVALRARPRRWSR